MTASDKKKPAQNAQATPKSQSNCGCNCGCAPVVRK